MRPAFGHHALRRKVHDMRRPLNAQKLFQRLKIMIDVDTLKPHRARAPLPSVRQERDMRLLGTARREHVMSGLRQKIAKGRAGKGVRPQNEKTGSARHRVRFRRGRS